MEQSTLSATKTHHREMTGGAFSAFARAQKEKGAGYTLALAIEGVHCAACIHRIESTLRGDSKVTHARVNMSTGRLSVSWRGAKEYGDALAAAVIGLGYRLKPLDDTTAATQKDDEQKRLVICMAVAGFAAGNLMLLSIGLWSTTIETMGIFTRNLLHWISAAIALPTILYAGRPFFESAIAVLRGGHTNMDVPISVALILTCAISLFETVSHGEHAYFDSAVMLLFFLLIGRYLDARAKGKAGESARLLLSRLGGTATILRGGKPAVIPVKQLKPGMTVLVAVGENIPADGIVAAGESDIDMSMITGETTPATITKGDRVFAGTVNMSAPLQITTAKAGEDSLLGDIVALMEKAEQGRARYVRLAERAARLYTPVVHVLGLATFLGWWLLAGSAWQVALLYGVTVLIITCPCALGLAVPVVQVLASGKLLRQGIILKSGDALERLAAITIAVFDKTGTLTLGKPELGPEIADSHGGRGLRLAASLAVHSKHPLSSAITRAYDGTLLPFENIREHPGKGLEGYHGGKKFRLGSRKWCGDSAAPQDDRPELWLAAKGKNPRRFIFTDPMREDAPQVMRDLHRGGIDTVLLSGDRPGATAALAKSAGITAYHAALSPVEKARHLEDMRARGGRVLMVGDGINDAPSLATADISVSPATALDITRNAADIVFQGEKLSPVLTAWQTARLSDRLVKQNFALAVIYNIIAIPLAMAGQVTPLIAAIAMSGSSLVVIGNSFRLNRRK